MVTKSENQNIILFKSDLHPQIKEKHIQQLTAYIRLRLFREPPPKFSFASLRKNLIYAHVM